MREIIVSNSSAFTDAVAIIEGDGARIRAIRGKHTLHIDNEGDKAHLVRMWDGGNQIANMVVDESEEFVREIMRAILYTPRDRATRVVRRESGTVTREKAFPMSYP